MYLVMIVLGICSLAGANCNKALAICSIIVGTAIIIKNLIKFMEEI